MAADLDGGQVLEPDWAHGQKGQSQPIAKLARLLQGAAGVGPYRGAHMGEAGSQNLKGRTNTAVFGARWCGAALQGFAELAQRAKVSLWHHDTQGFTQIADPRSYGEGGKLLAFQKGQICPQTQFADTLIGREGSLCRKGPALGEKVDPFAIALLDLDLGGRGPSGGHPICIQKIPAHQSAGPKALIQRWPLGEIH